MKSNRSSLVVLMMVWLVANAATGAELDSTVTRSTRDLERASGGPVKVVRSRLHGAATFIAMEPGRSVSVNAPANASAAARAESFLAAHGAALGLSETRVKRVHPVDETGMEHVRFEQTHRGVPVTAGEVIVHLRGSEVTAVNGKTLPNLDAVNTVPVVTAQQALVAARDLLAKHLGIGDAEMSEPRLEIFNRGLLEGSHQPTHLAWFIEARKFDFRRFIWVDAHSGAVLLHFSQLAHALSRTVSSADSGSSLPGRLVRSEGSAPSGDFDVDAAYDLSGIAYDYFFTQHGRDSFNNAGAPILTTVDYCPATTNCPYVNAFWNGTRMVYGDRFVTDDVLGHELTHAVTERSAGLFYYMWSGALNESYSDIFGETIDLLSSTGNDAPTNRWRLGEDLLIGDIRNMQDPASRGHPGKVSDPQFVCNWVAFTDADGDSGGVHSNSGVPNHAYALMVDGGSYNGYEISGIGLTNAAKVQYRALTTYLFAGADFLDNYHALKQACRDLIGAGGLTELDCDQVDKALDAVEMDRAWPCVNTNLYSETNLCPPTYETINLLFDDFELGVGEWLLDATAWGRTNMFSRSGDWHLRGVDRNVLSDTSAAMRTNVSLPPGALLQFTHAWAFEQDATRFYDGGVIEFSTNSGTAWSDAGAMIVVGGYNGTIQSGGLNNPLDGRRGFVADSRGYTVTRLDLSGLAGQDVRFRFRIGTDVGTGDIGWFIDDVRIYRCQAGPDTPPFIGAQPESRTVNEGLSNVSFAVTAYGTPPLAYQWLQHGLALTNATDAILRLTNVTVGHAGDYTVVVSNAFGTVTSAVATLTVRTIPRLVSPVPPLLLSAVLGETVTLNVQTTGELPIGYRWRHIRTNGSAVNVTNFVLHEHTSFLTFTVGTNSAGNYTIVLTNSVQPSSGTQRTNTILTVVADSDADGLPDAWEATYLNAGDPAADTDLDGLTNLQEYLAGTDPENDQSYLRVENIALAGGSNAVSLRFLAASNKTYTIQQRLAVEAGAWTRLADIAAAPTNRLVELTDTNGPPASPQHFYRLATPRVP